MSENCRQKTWLLPIIISLVIICILTIGLLFIIQSPLVPYNIRELVAADHPVLSSFLFTCFICWSFGFPVWMTRWIQKEKKYSLFFPGIMVIHGGVAWLFLRYAVPMESIHDIVGSPILSWPWEWEIIGRFLALFSIITITTTASSLLSSIIFYGSNKITAFPFLIYSIATACISHYIVVEKAATDNLTELMTSGGTVFSSFLLSVFLVIVTFTASQLTFLLTGRSQNLKKIIISSCIISFPTAFFCLYSATEKTIVKYGQEFSALQFLLSPDRQHFVKTPELLIRYAIAHTGIILLIALVQTPFRVWISNNKTGKPPLKSNEI